MQSVPSFGRAAYSPEPERARGRPTHPTLHHTLYGNYEMYVGYFRMVDAYVSVDHTGTAEPVRNHVCARSNGVRDAAVMISIAPSIGLLCLKLNGTKGRTDGEMGMLSWGFLMTRVAALPWIQLMTTVLALQVDSLNIVRDGTRICLSCLPIRQLTSIQREHH